MIRVVRAKTQFGIRLYLVDETCNFIHPVKQFLDYLAALEKSPHTQQSYCRHLRHYFSFLENSELDWQHVTPDNLVSFVQWLRNPSKLLADETTFIPSRLCERTVNTILAAVSSFYRYHIQRGVQISNPVIQQQISDHFSNFKGFLVHTSQGKTTQRLIKLKEPKIGVKTVSPENFVLFLNSIPSLQFKCLVLLMQEGGFRVGEVLGLLIEDLEFHTNRVWVRRRNQLENRALAKNMVAGEERAVDTDHLFVVLNKNAKDKQGHSTYGRPLGYEAVKAQFRYYSRKSGITIHPHLLRHTHATILIRAGWDASYVQKRLGHAQVQTTLNTYVHLEAEDLAQKWREYQAQLKAHKGGKASNE